MNTIIVILFLLVLIGIIIYVLNPFLNFDSCSSISSSPSAQSHSGEGNFTLYPDVHKTIDHENTERTSIFVKASQNENESLTDNDKAKIKAEEHEQERTTHLDISTKGYLQNLSDVDSHIPLLTTEDDDDSAAGGNNNSRRNMAARTLFFAARFPVPEYDEKDKLEEKIQTKIDKNLENVDEENIKEHRYLSELHQLPSQSPIAPLSVYNEKDPMEDVRVVTSKVEELGSQIEGFCGTSNRDTAYLELDESLTRELMKLERIETDGREDVREAQKNCIGLIQYNLSKLDSKLPLASYTAPVEVTVTKIEEVRSVRANSNSQSVLQTKEVTVVIE